MSIYICNICNYETNHKNAYKKHEKSKKHNQNITNIENKYDQNITNELKTYDLTNNMNVQNGNNSQNLIIELKTDINELKEIIKEIHIEKENNKCKIICEYCSKEFRHSVSKSRHITQLRCKMISLENQQKIKNKYNNKIIEAKHIKNTTNNSNNTNSNNITTNNTTNTNTNTNTNTTINTINLHNTVLNSHMHEIYDHITQDEVIEAAKLLGKGLENFIKLKLKDPKNRNIYVQNINSDKALVYKNPGWEYKNRKDAFDNASSKDMENLRVLYEKIRDKMNRDDFDELIGRISQQSFDKFMDIYDHAYAYLDRRKKDTKEAKEFRKMKIKACENAYMSIRENIGELYKITKNNK